MKLAAIWRHPVKSLGAERLASVTLAPGRLLPWDRTWALAHAGGQFDPAAPAWRPCGEFLRQTHIPEFARITAQFDPEARRLSLRHPALDELRINPDSPDGAGALACWTAALAEPHRAGPYRLCRLPEGGFTDAPEPWISIASTRSLGILSQRAGRPLEHGRFRANLWLDGLDPWEEFGLAGRVLRIGGAAIRIVEPIGRCRAIEASPRTGTHDTPVLALLREATGGTDFAMYGEVIEGGTVREGDDAL